MSKTATRSSSALDGADVAVIGAGNVGIAVAYYLVKEYKVGSVVLLDPRDPMSLTSAQSGENYRNWWPHPVMTAFTDHGIGLLEQIDRETGGRVNMTRGGYALVGMHLHDGVQHPKVGQADIAALQRQAVLDLRELCFCALHA